MNTGRAIGYLLVVGIFALPLCIFAPTLPAFLALASSVSGLFMIARGFYE